MKLVTYNIRFGLGIDQRIDLGRIAETVRDADIICLQEVERFWKRSGMSDQPEILVRHLKDFHRVYCPVFDVDASERKSDGTVVNRRRQFGPMLLSRWPIRASRIISLPKLGTVNRFNMDTGGIECVVDTPSCPLRGCSVHLAAVCANERLLRMAARAKRGGRAGGRGPGARRSATNPLSGPTRGRGSWATRAKPGTST